MKRRNRKAGPSDPQTIMLAAAKERAGRRAADKDPACWGISAEIVVLHQDREDFQVIRDRERRGRVLHAKRSDVFQLIDLSDEQLAASRRYMRDWCHRFGIETDDRAGDLEVGKIDHSPGLAPGQGINQRMIDAGKMLDLVHSQMGRADVRLLRGLVEPLVERGEVRVWRVQVQELTGETERHAQAAVVRMATANLVLAYEAADEIRRRERDARRAAAEEAARLQGA
jgi:hypothetical protein